jgi:hypothetical protein
VFDVLFLHFDDFRKLISKFNTWLWETLEELKSSIEHQVFDIPTE